MNTENHYQETDLGNIAPNPRGEYSPEESYEYLDLVVFEGGSYVCLAENGATITGISPESGKTTQYWQVITIPGSLTPEYIAMHDRVANLSEQVEADAEEVRTAEQNVSGIEMNVAQMQEQTRQSAEAAERSKDSAAGYASSADASRQAVATMAEQVAADKEQVASNRTAVENAKQEMTESAAQIEKNAHGISELKSDIANSKEAIAELADKKITKFYASNLGEKTLNDSDNGKIQDMMIFGKSLQDGTPTHDAPVKIQSVVNPVVTLSDGENSKTATLPYTLNAIAVPSDGNITIDGQLYKADYVDIERKKLVRMIGEVDLGTLGWNSKENLNSGFFASDTFTLAKGACLVSKYKNNLYSGSWENWGDFLISHNDGYRGGATGNSVYNAFIIKDTSLSGKIDKEVEQALSGIICYYELATPTETDLTDEEVQAFKELATYYPTTNVIVESDQLEGFTTFNYQISMANGWNYVKEQLGDTRDYIYDMDLQSAEAYVNSEYAVTLTELEV